MVDYLCAGKPGETEESTGPGGEVNGHCLVQPGMSLGHLFIVPDIFLNHLCPLTGQDGRWSAFCMSLQFSSWPVLLGGIYLIVV